MTLLNPTYLLLLVALISTRIVLTSPIIAQEKSRLGGTILGSVRDSTTGEPLIGANIELKSTQYRTFTDIDGKFILEGVAEGRYSVLASYIGYRKLLKRDILVIAGESTFVDFRMRETSILGLQHVPKDLPAVQLDPQLANEHSLFWRPIGLSDQTVLSLVTTPDGQLYAGTYGGRVYRSFDFGSSWHQSSIVLTRDPVGSLAVSYQGDILAGTYFNGHLILTSDPIGIFLSSDKGFSWHQVLSSIWINSIKLGRKGEIYVCSNTFDLVSEFFTSTDGGRTWSNNAKGLPPQANIMAVDPVGNILISAFRKGVYSFNSSDSSWHQHSSLVDTSISDLLFHPNGDVYAATDQIGVLRSKDGGRTWAAINNGLEDLDTDALALNSKGHIFVATESAGIYRSTNLGDSWLLVGPELTATVKSLVADSAGFLYAGTEDYGIFKSALPTY